MTGQGYIAVKVCGYGAVLEMNGVNEWVALNMCANGCHSLKVTQPAGYLL